MGLTIDTSEHSGCTVVVLEGRLDTFASGGLEEVCENLARQGINRIVFDLSGLVFLSSSGLRVFLAAAKRHRSPGGGVAVTGARGVVREALTVSGFSDFMPVTDELDEAIAAL